MENLMVCVKPFRSQFGGVCTRVSSTYVWEWPPPARSLNFLCILLYMYFNILFPLWKCKYFDFRYSVNIIVCFKGTQPYLFNFFFKLLEILLSQESLYCSHNPQKILQLRGYCTPGQFLHFSQKLQHIGNK